MAVTMRQKRGTRAQIDAAAAADGLVQGEVYLITDEGNLAMATGTGTYETYVKAAGFTAMVRLTESAYAALSPPDAGTVYIVTADP